MPQTLATPRRVLGIVAFLLLSGVHARAGAGPERDDDSVWVEGESASVRHVTPHPWYSEAVRKEQMSGGAWLSHFSATSDGSAQYDLVIPKDGEFALWVRANPVGSALAYQLNGGSWTEIDTSKAIDVVNLAVDDKPDLRVLGWMRGGKLTLKKGPASLTFKMHSAVNHHGAIDCFVLTARPFEPRGVLKPGEVQPPPDVPVLGDANLRKWIDFIRPSDADTKWERLDWRTELGAAVQEAKALQRPILLWTMNGHPLGCT
jgi:hypothetical protein